MQHRTTGRRLGLAVTAVLSVTALGTLAIAPTAFAAVVAPAAADQAAASLPVFPKDSLLAGGGTSGFLTQDADRHGNDRLLWTSYKGGFATRLDLPADGYWGTGAGDVVVLCPTTEMRSVTLRNMATPSAPGVSIDLDPLNGTYVAVLSPTSVLAQLTNEDGTAELHVVTRTGTTTTTRRISGLPADAAWFTGSTVRNGSVLVTYVTDPEGARTDGVALIDVAAGSVSATHSGDPHYGFFSPQLSGSHLAWLDQTNSHELYVNSVDRATGAEKRTPLPDADSWGHFQLVGGWLVYGKPWTAVRAVSLTTGETRELGMTASGAAGSVADGSAVLAGTGWDEGDGLFRIAAAADGTPKLSKVAETGTPVLPLTIDRVDVPAVAEIDKTNGRVTLEWELSRDDADVNVTVTQVATGRKVTQRLTAPRYGTVFSFTWEPIFDEQDAGSLSPVDAQNGAYTVAVKATPDDGVGAPVSKSSPMSIVRAFNPHDFNDNGSTDVLARDSEGVLWRNDLSDRAYYGDFRLAKTTRIGAGWGAYKQIEAVGDIGGAKHGDVIALDGSGVLWLYQGKGDGTFAGRVKVGSGWGGYNKLAGGSDLNGDGRSDLLATDASGTLWFYKGTGSTAAPFATRVRVGGGWGAYNHLTAVGNIAGTAAGDLVARDTTGVLWLYQGKGDGTFAGRVKVGGGWGGFRELVGAGDLDNDGRPDLIAYGPGSTYGAYVYRSTGVVTAPFNRRTTDLFKYQGDSYSSVS
ncbi:FG-GAP repeat domain-containing protein [Streptomyces sp. NPDC127584]|uniref:FG-GAP repeat domain-containing protein n=1 Tax=Streptomyces sp. NPDC127584 TaxID=3345403 RepID=UPI003630AB85